MTRDRLQTGWQYRAKCQGPQATLFFAPNRFERKEERRERESEAKAICAVCPVTEECIEYALRTREEHGVWGGLNETQRRALAERAG